MTKKEKAAKERTRLRAEGAKLRKCRANILAVARAWYCENFPDKFTAAARAHVRREPHDWLPSLKRLIEEEAVLKGEARTRRRLRKEAKKP